MRVVQTIDEYRYSQACRAIELHTVAGLAVAMQGQWASLKDADAVQAVVGSGRPVRVEYPHGAAWTVVRAPDLREWDDYMRMVNALRCDR